MINNPSRRELLTGFALLVGRVLPLDAFYQSNPPKPQPEDPIADKVKHIIVEQLGVDSEKVVPSARFVEDLGADSLDQVELVMAFEEAFDLEIPDEDCEKLPTVWSVVRYLQKRKGLPLTEPASTRSAEGKRALSNEAFGPYPKDCKYTKEHEWIRARGNSALIGITNYAQESLGDIVFLELPKVGTQIERGKSFGAIESVKAVYELYAPVSGKVASINESLRHRPKILNEDANRAWMMKLNLTDTKELDTLLSAEDYEAFVRKERTH